MARADAMRKKRDWDGLRAVAEDGLKARPGDGPAMAIIKTARFGKVMTRAEAAFQSKNMDLVKSLAEEAIAILPESKRARELLELTRARSRTPRYRARQARKAGRWIEARNGYREILKLTPGDAEALAALKELSILDWKELRTVTDEVRAVTVHPKNGLFATGGPDGRIVLRVAKDLSIRSTWAAHSGAIKSLAYSSDGRILSSWAEDGSIILWDLRRGRKRTCPLRGPPPRAVALSPKGTHLAAGLEDGRIFLWLISLGTAYLHLEGHKTAVHSLTFDGTGKMLVSGDADGTVRTWDIGTSKTIRTQSIKGGAVRSIAFHPSGKLLASTGSDGAIRVWDGKSGKVSQTLTAKGNARQVTFAPNGRLLVSVGENGLTRLWDLESGTELRRLGPSKGRTWSVAFSPEGSPIVSGSTDGLRAWGPPGK